MKLIMQIIPLLAALAFAVLAATGIDLINSRTGFGMVALGVALFLFALLVLCQPAPGRRFGLAALVVGGGAYFVTRAYSVGPVSLAYADVSLVLGGLGVYLAVAFSGEKSRRNWIALVMVVAVLNAVIALYQQWGPGIYYFWQTRTGDRQMVGGFFGHYNAFASYLNGSIFFLLSYVALGKRMGLRVVLGLAALAMVGGLVYSGSRGGWVSFVIGGAVWLVFLLIALKRSGSRLFGPAALIGIMLAVAGGVTSVGVIRNLTEKRQLEQNRDLDPEVDLADADGGRFAFQQMAFEVFQDEPILGRGPRAFSYRSLEKWDRDSLGIWSNLPVYAHNEFMQTLSDYGLIGFLILLVLIFAHGIIALLGVSTGDSMGRDAVIWQIGAAGGLAAMLCQSFFSFLFHYPACVALAAVQLGLLASPNFRARSGGAVMGRIAGLAGLAVAVSLVIVGWSLGRSYLLQREGKQDLAAAVTKEQAFRAFDSLTKAGNLAKDPDLFEWIARDAMFRANQAEEEGDAGLAREYNSAAKSALSRSLELNPHFGEGLAGLPRVNDKLGNYEEAEKGHQKAMSELWTREISLRPHYQAARSSFFKSFRAENSVEALALLYQARERLQKRLRILRMTRDFEPLRGFGEELEAWIAYREGRQLFKKGNDIWWNARPRNPRLAMALMLEARKRYEVSRAVVSKREPLWERDWKQLETNLGAMRAGQTNPVILSPEEVVKFLEQEVGLATKESGR
jgi:O-antigen ligase/tetratricopeptide (TPR) repeat protein